MRNFDKEDKNLLVELYGLNGEELKQAEKMFRRTSMSACACGKTVAKKRPQIVEQIMKFIKSTMSRQQIIERTQLIVPVSFILGTLLGFSAALFILNQEWS